MTLLWLRAYALKGKLERAFIDLGLLPQEKKYLTFKIIMKTRSLSLVTLHNGKNVV
jgi:hypothetical protein